MVADSSPDSHFWTRRRLWHLAERSLDMCRLLLGPGQTYGKGFDTGPPQVGAVRLCFSVGFRCFWPFSLGSWPAFLPSRPYFRVCVLVAVSPSTKSPCMVGTFADVEPKWSSRDCKVERSCGTAAASQAGQPGRPGQLPGLAGPAGHDSARFHIRSKSTAPLATRHQQRDQPSHHVVIAPED